MGRVGHQPAGEFEMEALQKLLSGYKKARDEGFAPVNPALEGILSSRKSEEFFNDQSIHVPGLTDGQNDFESQEITPEPFYFVKLCDMEGQKVFINMCGCLKIAAPGQWQNGVPPELEESFSVIESKAEDGTQNMRFSLSCSDYIISTDKQGQLCKVYDVVFNLIVVKHSKVHKQLRTFLINMAITWISQKYHIEFKSDFKLPKGKYKGDVVRKHYIRAVKARKVTEIFDEDAELRPSFPLLTDRASHPSESLVETSQSENKSIDLSQPVLATQASASSSAFSIAEDRAARPSHQEISKENINVMEDNISNTFSVAPCESKTCDSFTSVTAQDRESQSTIKSNTDMEQGVCRFYSSVPSEQKKMASQLWSCIPFQEITMQYTDSVPKQTPSIQIKYLGCPVELVILRLSLPSSVEMQQFKVWASNTELYVEATSCHPVVVPLVFSTVPTEAKAAFFQLESLLEVYLPFLTFLELFT